MQLWRKLTLALAIGAAALLLSGCPSFDVGGWIDSVNLDGKNTKATFGGSFTCTEMHDGIALQGTLQYHDHNFMIKWKNKDRDLSFHGDLYFDYAPIPSCEMADLAFILAVGLPDGYCGPARLQPAPRSPNDWGYGVDFAYRVAVSDDDEDEIWVWLGPAGIEGCPINRDEWKDFIGRRERTECDSEDPCYNNYGVLGGGNVTVYYPFPD